MTKPVYIPALGRSLPVTRAILYFAKHNATPQAIDQMIGGVATRSMICAVMYQGRKRGLEIPKWKPGRRKVVNLVKVPAE